MTTAMAIQRSISAIFPFSCQGFLSNFCERLHRFCWFLIIFVLIRRFMVAFKKSSLGLILYAMPWQLTNLAKIK